MEETLWHPVAQAAEVTGDAPLGVRLLERDVVLWRSPAGQVQAWANQCPHRGAKLSLGRVEGGRLACAYHGWQFAAGGACLHVPALPAFTPPADLRVQAHAAREAYGLVWVQLAPDAAAAAGVPLFEAETDARLRKITCGPYDVASSAPRVVENFLDLSHFAFVHEGGLGTREATAVDDYRVEPTPTGLRATGCKAWQPRSTLHSTGLAQVEYGYEVVAPYTAVLTKVPDAGTVGLADYHEAIALFVSPAEHEACRVWFRMALADFAASEESVRAFQDAIFAQDRPVLESQRPRRLPLKPGAERHMASDKASVAYRRHLTQTGITFGVC